jgi:type IV fimbrial biogenesis protein FimT
MKSQIGLTLVELMVTLAVAIIMMAFAIPSIDRMQASNRVTDQANALVTAVTVARTEAVTRGVAVAICAKADSSPADTSCGTASDWVNGWQVFLDNGSNTGSYNTADEQLVQVFNKLSGSPQVTASAASVRFLRDGTLDSSLHAGSESFLLAQDVSGLSRSCVQISAVGQPSTDKISSTDSCP